MAKLSLLNLFKAVVDIVSTIKTVPTTVVKGTSGPDAVKGTTGSDIIIAGNGKDRVDAGKGDDIVFGGKGDDSLFGDAGNDVLFGGSGDDFLVGLNGNDTLFGGAGNDVLRGSGGHSRLWGGTGADEFTIRIESQEPVAFNRAGLATISQWVEIRDLSFKEGDFIRFTGFDNVLNAAGVGLSLDSLAEVKALATYLDTQTYSFDAVSSNWAGSTLILTDNRGALHAVSLDGIFL